MSNWRLARAVSGTALGVVGAETVGRNWVCRGLLATVGLGEVRLGNAEPHLVTAGQDAEEWGRWLPEGREGYTAAEAMEWITC